MIITTDALDLSETKKLMIDLFDAGATLIDEYGEFEIDQYWMTHFTMDFQYNSSSKWVYKINLPDHLVPYIILKYGINENIAHK